MVYHQPRCHPQILAVVRFNGVFNLYSVREIVMGDVAKFLDNIIDLLLLTTYNMDWKNRALALLKDSLEPVPSELNEIDWKSGLSDKTDRLARIYHEHRRHSMPD